MKVNFNLLLKYQTTNLQLSGSNPWLDKTRASPWLGSVISCQLSGYFSCQMEENSVKFGSYTVIFPNKVLWFLEFLNNTLYNLEIFQFFRYELTIWFVRQNILMSIVVKTSRIHVSGIFERMLKFVFTLP